MQLSECVKIPAGNLRNFCVDSCVNNSCQQFFEYVDSIHFARAHPAKLFLHYSDSSTDKIRVKLPQELLFNSTRIEMSSRDIHEHLVIISICSALLLAFAFLASVKRRRISAK